jgi:hypothetical protein
LEFLLKITSAFLDSFSGLMPYFLLGILASAGLETFVDSALLQRISRGRIRSIGWMILLAILFPVAKGGALPLARRLVKKGIPLYAVLCFLTAAPILNLLTLDNTWVAFGWGPLLLYRMELGILLALLVGLVFSFIFKEFQNLPEDAVRIPASLETHKGDRFIEDVLHECFEWLPVFILGCFLAAVFRSSLPLSEWMNSITSTPLQAATAMLYSMVLSISSTVDCFVALNWLERFPLSTLLAFLLSGAMIDVRGIVMMVKGFGVKPTFYWSAWVLVLILVSVLLLQLGIRG